MHTLETSSSTQASTNPSLRIDIEAARRLNFAMVENAVSLVERISVTNTSEEALTDIEIRANLMPDFGQVWKGHIRELPAGGTFHLDDVILPLSRERFINQVEAQKARLLVQAKWGDQSVQAASSEVEVKVMAYNEWHALSLPQLLSAFVMPNHPVIAETLKMASKRLELLTGDPALDGYQSKSEDRVRAIAQAIYETLQALDVTYSNPPASFEDGEGQKIRTPEQLLEHRLGTCLDLSVFTAACLEQAGLNSLLFLIKGHAFPGVWLIDHSLAEASSDDGSRFSKLCSLGQILVYDSSAVAMRPLVSFARAVAIGTEYLTKTETFHWGLCVAGSRRQKYYPLPARMPQGYQLVPSESAQRRPVDLAASQACSQILSIAQDAPVTLYRAPSTESESEMLANANIELGRIEGWKQRLLDTSLRNKLLNFKETKVSVEILCPDVARLEDLLADGETFDLASQPEMLSSSDPRSVKQVDLRSGGDALKEFLSDVMEGGVLHAKVSSEAHAAKLTGIFRQARESLQETGSNTLCIALGFLEWYESESSEKCRLAPLLLIPARLERKASDNSFRLSSSDEGTRINVTLLEKLKMDTGITIPELAELPEDASGVDVPRILNMVRKAVLKIPRWNVREEVHLGHFSFTKFLMWNDLEAKSGALLDSPLVKHLALSKGETFPFQGDFPACEMLDDNYPPDDLICPLDADSTQLAAIAAAADNKTFVLQGPPGTGKSQTISNLIAHCLSTGKRVLFVSEKMAALEVVARRLSRIGLGNYCLELHSNKSRKSDIISDLEKTLRASRHREPSDWQQATTSLEETRGKLNRYAAALHLQRSHGLSYFQVISRLMALRTAPRIELSTQYIETQEKLAQVQRLLVVVAEASAPVSPIAMHPWLYATLPTKGLTFAEDTARLLETFADAAAKLASVAQRIASETVGMADVSSLEQLEAMASVSALLTTTPSPPRSLLADKNWEQIEKTSTAIIGVGKACDEGKAMVLEKYRPDLFELDLTDIAARFRQWGAAFFLLSWWMLRNAKKTLRRVTKLDALASNAEINGDLECALNLRDKERELADMAEAGRRYFESYWAAPKRDWTAMERLVLWSEKFRQGLASVLKDVPDDQVESARELLLARADGSTPVHGETAALSSTVVQALEHFRASRDAFLAHLGMDEVMVLPTEKSPHYLGAVASSIETWRKALPQLRDWRGFLEQERLLRETKLGPLADALRSGELNASALCACFDRVFYESWAARVLAVEPALADFSGTSQVRRIQEFTKLDNQVMNMSGSVAAARISARVPVSSGQTTGTSEVGILMREARKKRSQMPIRQLFKNIPKLLSVLKPCVMMSPLSVAQYLDPDGEPFDLVVFDEASQMPTYDAIGALARGKRAVIVGDTKQLPPTSFFSSSSGNEDYQDDEDFEELESILDECVASRVPELLLGWHYRSRHESLIAFSNYHYYENRLNTFPSVAETVPNLGVSLRMVNGSYDKGKSRSNPAEAQAVVAEVVARLTDPVQSRRSIGIVTFSKAQQDRIENLLDEARRAHPEIEKFFGDEVEEELIVKNLENIQGDERDVMFFSICYGPDINGKVAMNFGPINREGGQRRLNVAVTRAREELVVFSTLRSDQIDLARTKSLGVKHLKTFLDYAARGPQAIAEAITLQGDQQFDSPFEEEVFQKLSDRGWRLQTQVGCAGYRIDMGVYHPEYAGKFVLGIECDGAHYHSAKTARDRDRLRSQVLGGLGWQLHRIWSTDWWDDAEGELDKVEHAIRAAIETALAREEKVAQLDDDVSDTLAPSPSDGLDAPGHHEFEEVSGSMGEPYQIAQIDAYRRVAEDCYSSTHMQELCELTNLVLLAEAPVSPRALAKRIAPYWSLARTTKRFEARIQLAMEGLIADHKPRLHDGFYWLQSQSPDSYEGFRIPTNGDNKRDVIDIPLEEIGNAVRAVLAANLSMSAEDLARESARLVGFNRLGGKVSARMHEAIDLVVDRGGALRNGEMVARP